MADARDFPYIWTTWLPRLLTGENSCEWAIWFKAHHQNWAKTPSDFNQAEWLLNHTSLLKEKKSQWEARRQHVYVEGQNSFRLRGRSATLAGRPDLIVVRGNDALIIDIKAGREQPSHYVQIMIYMYALPRALQQYQYTKLAGEVVYPTHGTSTNGKSAHAVHKGPRSLDPPARCRQASSPSAQPTRMPLLRHHRRRLRGTDRRRPDAARGHHSGILRSNSWRIHSKRPVRELPPTSNLLILLPHSEMLPKL